MEIFEIDSSRIGTGKVFPDHIESQDWIGYHGTSSGYSEEIEKAGFSLVKPISESDIDFVIDLMQREGIDPSAVQGFKKLASISFSPISEICLAYCESTTLGGQGVGYVKKGVDSFLSGRRNALTDGELVRLQSIDTRILEIRNADPVIYAVRLQGIGRIEYQNLTKAVHAYEPVSKDRIIAKLRVDRSFDVGQIDVNKFKQQLHNIFWSGKDHYIRRIGR